MNWIAAHPDLINVMTNVGMLIVWITYLRVFLAGYLRQRKATILIDVGGGKGLAARCLVTNLSTEPIYIHTLIATLHGEDGEIVCPVTEPGDSEHWQGPSDLKLWTRQGPLESGKVRDMGSLQAILDHVRTTHGPEGDARLSKATEIELQVVAVYGSEDVMVAARRCFSVTHDDDALELRAVSVNAEQIRSLRERRAIVRMLEKQLEDS